MLDNFSELVLKQFIKDDREYTDANLAHFLKVDNLDLIEKSIDILLECNYIKIKYQDITYTSYCLTNNGRNYFKKHNADIFYKYFYPILTALISLVLSLLLK